MSELYHYGTPRHSGRYPWGSGDNPYQHGAASFLGQYNDLKSKGLSESEIAKAMGMNTTQLRNRRAIARSEKKKEDIYMAYRLKEKGLSNVEIGKRMGINESSVRALLDPTASVKNDAIQNTADILKKQIEKNEYIDVGVGTERYLGVSRTKLKNSLAMLEDEGYKIQYVPIEQLGTGKKTNVMVLTGPDVDYSTLYKNKDKISMVQDVYSEDNGHTWLNIEPPKNINSNRVQIRYAEDGGKDKDGVIELRRNVDDLDMGNSKYAQVRIAVDGTHYLKGMAMYSDNMPDGVDIIFNTNKHKDVPKMKVLKEQSGDPDNPFGATISRQSGALNIVNEEGDWGKWSKSLASQMLSKQPISLAKQQLTLGYNIKKDEFDEILSLTNPTIRKKLLESFADDCDASAVHLKAAAMPRQASHVILPFPNMKENEIYAPNYRDGETVVLIRYPHGGKFEIPELKVNNKNPDAKKLIYNAKDAVGINSKVAERLSGADFDGDTVLVIPNNKGQIKTSPSLKGLKNFDPQEAYKAYDGMPKVSKSTGFHKQTEMGKVSNLITDMTIKGATDDEIARAVRHSMVVIDAEKHNLNWRQSYIDNDIPALTKKYQQKPNGKSGGASTLISKAKSEERVPYREEGEWYTDKETGKTTRRYIDPKTGEKLYNYTGETYTTKTGKTVAKTTKSTKMYEAKDAYSLSSGQPIENVYADYANKMKSLGNQARKEYLNTPPLKYSPSAKETYKKEVDSLNSKLNVALKNAPLERQAQIRANSIVAAKKRDNPDMEYDEVKKIKGQALAESRVRTGAAKERINITPKEWEAIQAGAISNSKLITILDNTDLDVVKSYATPRQSKAMSQSKIQRAKSLYNNGYSTSDIADILGVSTSTITESLKE